MLTSLNIGFNKLTELPLEISQLNFLVHLEVRDNPALHDLPALDNLKNLQTLSIRNLQIQQVPVAVFKLAGYCSLRG